MARKDDVKVAMAHAAEGYISIPIYYNAREGRFRATYAGVAHTGATQADVEAAVVAAAEESLNVLWTPVVEIEIGPFPGNSTDSWRERATVELEFQRYYCTRLRGKLLQASWNTGKVTPGDSDAQRLERAREMHWDSDRPVFAPPFVLPHKTWSYSRWTAYLVHTEQLWSNLLLLQTSLRNVHTNLIDLISTPAGQTALAVALVLPYIPALPAPQEAPSP